MQLWSADCAAVTKELMHDYNLLRTQNCTNAQFMRLCNCVSLWVLLRFITTAIVCLFRVVVVKGDEDYFQDKIKEFSMWIEQDTASSFLLRALTSILFLVKINFTNYSELI